MIYFMSNKVHGAWRGNSHLGSLAENSELFFFFAAFCHQQVWEGGEQSSLIASNNGITGNLSSE